MKRRTFVGALAAAIPTSRMFASGSAAPNPSFPTEPRTRLAVASYPFRKDVDPHKGSLKLVDFPKMVADRFNVHGIEPLDEHFASTDAAYLNEFRAALDKAGSRVVNIPVGRLHGSFYDPNPEKRNIAISNTQKWVDVAVALNCPGIRVHIQGVSGASPSVDLAAESLKRAAEYGQSKNIVISLENDDPRTEDAFFLVDILNRAATPWLRALPDFCNSMLLKKGEDYNYRAVKAMFAHACTICHTKEVENDGPTLYRINLAQCVKIARDSGYRGYFSMEWDSEGDPYAGTQHLIDETLKALA